MSYMTELRPIDTESMNSSLIRILGLLGDEVLDLGRTIEQLQVILAPALFHVADDPACHRNAQKLDLLTQRLHALADFVSSIKTSVPPSWHLDFAAALRRVKLSDLAWRLKGERPEEPLVPAGEADFF